ncbi:unnamed protein product [Trifolium pratense]|uniref:Uncharacterized protein n=1 Tax=Trifolium pratense TaxID=57577 RepID=A0ACB0KXB3_TRIPR|nr:unnamed protein product [Trifolium pratense]
MGFLGEFGWKSHVLSSSGRSCSLQLAAARHEQVTHWCGSLKHAEPSLSEQLAKARLATVSEFGTLFDFAQLRYFCKYFYHHRHPTYSKEMLDEVKEEWLPIWLKMLSMMQKGCKNNS